jgi:hypothetical protein
MSEKTNIGKKDTRQVDRLITKSVQEGRERFGGKEAEARYSPKVQRLKPGRKGKAK